MKITLENIEGSEEVYLKIMKAICGNTEGKSMVDLGCHLAPYTPKLGFAKNTYVDILDRPIDHSEQQRFFVKEDMILFLKNCETLFDVAISSDSIEHLTKENGYELVVLMQRKSRKQIIFTPLGEYMVDDKDNGNPDSHRSGWMPEDLVGWASVVLPNFHPKLNTGAFFAWHCDNIEQDFERAKNELKSII